MSINASPYWEKETIAIHAPEFRERRVRAERLISTGSLIAATPPRDDERHYMHSILCQVGLPRSKVNGTSFERRSGRVALLVEAGRIWTGQDYVQQPLPYGGSIPISGTIHCNKKGRPAGVAFFVASTK
jgi:hypothetical protein